MTNLKYKVGDKVRIKSIDWYNENKDENGYINCGSRAFFTKMSDWCGEILTINRVVEEFEYYCVSECIFSWTDEMIEGLVEKETKPKFKVGDRVMAQDMSGIWEITKVEDDILYTIKRENHTFTLTTYGSFLTLYEGITDKKEEMKSENELLDEYEELTDRAFKGGYQKCKSDIELNGFQLPEGYIFKDQAGNEIHALKIVLEKANTLKIQSDNTLKIQSDNMETETHRGYYTTEEETTNKSKKVAWFTFRDNDFADKVELDLSNRELIQEDGKWFVVKKKKEYPKTYEECCEIVGCLADYVWGGYKQDLFQTFHMLYICRDAYWKVYGEENGLGKPWEPSKDKMVYSIYRHSNEIETNIFSGESVTFEFPTPEMRDVFYENFKKEIEFVKELL